MSDEDKNSKINKCLDDLRYAYKHKVPLESVLNSYRGHANPQYISEETYKNFCLFIYEIDLDNEGILKNLEKYPNYETFIKNKSNFIKFFIKRAPQVDLPPKKMVKKYTTHSAHGHFQTNNPIFAFLNYIAMLPVYILIMTVGGISKIFVSFFDLFKSDKK